MTTGPRGTYVTVGSGGVTYRQRIGSPNQVNKVDQPNRLFQVNDYSYDPTDASLVKTASIDELSDSSFKELIDSINERISQPSYFLIVLGIFILLFFLTGGFLSVVSWILLVIGILLTSYFSRGDDNNKTTPIFYDLSIDSAKRFQTLSEAINSVSKSEKIWRVNTQQANSDWKRNAGATSLLSRSAAKVEISNPPFISSNIKIPGLILGQTNLWFMPDFLLLRQDNKYAAIDYHDLNMESYTTRFVEGEAKPSDARVLGSTWQYVNKRGGPDKRFNNNRQIPIMEYGETNISSDSGLNIVIHISNLLNSQNFSQAFKGFKAKAVHLK